jgi:transposase
MPPLYRSQDAKATGGRERLHRGNRAPRYVILLVAEDLLKCNEFSHGLGESWRAAGAGCRAVVVRAAKRLCRIAYRMMAGREVFRHPSCRERHYIIDNLIRIFYNNYIHMDQVLHDSHEAVNRLPPGKYAAEAERLRAAVLPARGPVPPSRATAELRRASNRAAPAERDPARGLAVSSSHQNTALRHSI